MEEVLALKEAKWKAENEALRASLAEASQQRLRESTAQWQQAAAAAAAVPPGEQVRMVAEAGSARGLCCLWGCWLADPINPAPAVHPLHKMPAFGPRLPPAWQVECYEIEVVTGSKAGAGTTARVYLELVGDGGASGEHRLMYREGAGRAAFAASATDAFKLHCRPLGDLRKVRQGGVGKDGAVWAGWVQRVWLAKQTSQGCFFCHAWCCMGLGSIHLSTVPHPLPAAPAAPLLLLLLQVRVFHNNAGPSPDWFLQEVRVHPAGAHSWTVFPCGRWLAVHQDDG